jgi:DedD protein
MAEARMAPITANENQDTEIILGTGKLLGLFFGLVALCAVFFGMGYKLGHSVSPSPDPVELAAIAPVAGNTSGLKPTAARVAAQPSCDAKTDPNCQPQAAKSDSDELAFFKNANPAQTTGAAQQPASQPGATSPPQSATATTTSAPATTTTPELAKPGAASFVVQVAAVSAKDDADRLQAALQAKRYPVFIVSDSPDHLFHVQVGPFAERNDAISMRDRLSADGYNPIVK